MDFISRAAPETVRVQSNSGSAPVSRQAFGAQFKFSRTGGAAETFARKMGENRAGPGTPNWEYAEPADRADFFVPMGWKDSETSRGGGRQFGVR